MDAEIIKNNTRRILKNLPAHVSLVAAAKTRSSVEQQACIEAGVTTIGHNYVQEAERSRMGVGLPVRWHLIGHLQRNKVKKAIALFDLIETLDNLHLAEALERHCATAGKTIQVFLEINSAGEDSKSGLAPDKAEDLARALTGMPHVQLRGLMTMGPTGRNAEDLRPFFRQTRELFDHLAGLNLPGVHMQALSMGMSDSYRIAIEEGATVVRIGSLLFGPRISK